MKTLSATIAATAFLALLSAGAAEARPVLLISIDALSPDYVTKADSLGLKVPNLRRFLKEGSYATGVRGVVPTITCTSHATIVTGVTPNQHGIYGNNPLKTDGFSSILCTFASDIKVDALYDAAARAGIESGSVGWLNTAGSPNVKYNLPYTDPYESEIAIKLQETMARPDGLLTDLQAELGSYYQNNKASGSEVRLRFASEIINRYKPGFMMFHTVSVDSASHSYGPWSDDAKRAVEHEDEILGKIMKVALDKAPDTIIVVTSDHGQVPITRALNLHIPLVEAGLVELEPLALGREARVKSSKLQLVSGASAAIWLKDPADAAARAKISEVLRRLAADPANGIDRVVEGGDVEKLGGYPGAAFVLGMKPGTVVGSDYIGEKITTYPSVRGTHGYLPEISAMNASFFAMGQGIKPGQNLGVIDMVQIAPTLAQALGVTLKDAKAPALPVFSAQRARQP
jgi:predicted AlkP superfamily pyrophosphatase or phosphodiesterase